MKCSWTTSDGLPCDADAQAGKETCWFHDPEIEESRQEARRRGGRASRAPQRPVPIVFDVSSPEAILGTLDAVGKAMAAGQCDRAVANTFGILARNAVETHRIVAFGRRIRKLEELAGVVPEGETP